MQATAVATSVAASNLRWHSSLPPPAINFPLRASELTRPTSSPFLRLTCRGKGRGWSKSGPLRCASADGPSSLGFSDRWLLEPVGDGDSRHLGSKVPLPGAFEVDSDVVTIGRVPEKASVVIPVATVSGLHARLEKKEGSLFVTDLNSTNSTFIDDKRLPPGAAVEVPPGSCVIFGDANLAMFRVSKLADGTPKKMDEPESAE